MGVSYAFIMFLVLGLLGAVGAILAVVVVSRRQPTHPACGRCGYAVAGLESLQCPECGADLRAVGIVVPRRRQVRVPVAIAVALLATFFLFITLSFSMRAVAASAMVVVTQTDISLRAADPDFPVVEASQESTGHGGPWVVRIRPRGAATSQSLALEPHDPEPLRAQAIEQWLGGLAPEAERERVHAYAADLAKVLAHQDATDALSTAGTIFNGASAGRSTSMRQSPRRAQMWLVLAGHVVAWLVVVVLLVRWARRRPETDAKADATPAA